MFRRYAQFLKKAVPLSAMMATCYFTFTITRMTQEPCPTSSRFMSSTMQLFRKSHPRIKFVRDLYEYAEKLLVKDRSIIIFELTGDPFIDIQVVTLAQTFIDHHQNDLSADFQFIFLEERHSAAEEGDDQNYFILYTPNGQKLINIDSYINKCKEKPEIKVNTRPLMKRIIEHLNTYKEVGLANISTQLMSIDHDNNYIALVTSSQSSDDTLKAKGRLKEFERQNQVKVKNLNKYILKDEQTKRIFGINSRDDGKTLLIVPDSPNLRKEFQQNADFFSINGKKFTKIDASANLNQIFVFPPIQKSLKPQQFVLNVYINKNRNYEHIQSKIYEELSKPQYSKYAKAIYYSSDVEEASIFYEKNDYSSECLKAYEKNTSISKEAIRNTLTHTFQYQFLLNSKESIDSARLKKWLNDCENNQAQEHFPSEKPHKIWAQQITGEQYKSIVDLPTDKVIYHYSHHCHGCKKFGGKYEEFARDRSLRYPDIDFYRINNDNNKAEGVRNYNSTPVFVFYKNGYQNPFIYRMPIFTEQLFDSFLRITSQVKLMPLQKLQKHIKQHSTSNFQVKQLIEEVVN